MRWKRQIEKINKNDVKGYQELLKFTKKIFEKGFLRTIRCSIQ